MFRLLLATLLCSLPALAAEEAPAPAAPALKVGVVSFAALSGEVPLRAGAKASAMLSTELKNLETVQLMEAKKPPPAEPFKEALSDAKALVDQAQALRAQHKFRAAEDALVRAIAEYKTAGAGLSDIAEVQDAYALLSAIQYNTGRDEDAQTSLSQALALSPGRELPLAATSPLFARVVTSARKAVLGATKGALVIESTPSAATVSVDGATLGNTPLIVRSVPPGMHLWRVQLPSGEATGGAVEVASSKTAKVNGQIAGSDPESRLLAALAQNKLDPSSMATAKEAAAAMEADWLVFGALSRDGKSLNLDSFLLNVATGEVRRLPRSTFDAELLSAGVELFNLAGEIAGKGAAVGQPAKVPGPVSPGRAPGPKEYAEVEYGLPKASLEADAQGDTAPPQDGTRTPLQQKRKPLKR